MKKILYLKAYTRLGLYNPPFGSTEYNRGVENAPDAILSKSFLTRHSGDIVEYHFTDPETIDYLDYFKTIAKESKECVEKINSKYCEHKISCIIGGDHSAGFPSLLSILERTNGTVGVISFDSHADLHCIRTSKSGNFHGMWLRPFMENFDDLFIDALVKKHLGRVKILYVGNINPGEGEKEIIEKNNNVFIESKKSFTEESKNAIKNFIESVDRVHISFDIDVFKTELAPATGTPNDNGYDRPEIEHLIDSIVFFNKVYSIDIVEVNPKKEHSDSTVLLAQEMLSKMLSAILTH